MSRSNGSELKIVDPGNGTAMEGIPKHNAAGLNL